MALIKKYKGKEEVIANKSVIDHNQLANRNQYGAHKIEAIRGLPEKLTQLKDKDKELEEQIGSLETSLQDQINTNKENIAANTRKIEEVENKAKGISVQQKTGSFDFTDYDGNKTNIKTGYSVDNSTIVVENEQYVVKGIDNRDKLEDDPFKNNAIKARDLNDYAKETKRSISSINAEIENINSRDDTQDGKIQDLLTRTKGLGGYINATNFGSAIPSQDDLSNYALQQIFGEDWRKHLKTEIFNQTKVTNLFDKNVWILTNTPDSDPVVFDWANKGQEAISIATSTTLGIVKGSNDEYKASVDLNGEISINNLNDKINELDNRDTDLGNRITLLSKTKATETQLGLVYFWKDDEEDWNISTIDSYSSEDIPNVAGITLNVTARKVKTQVNATGTTLILD